MKTIEKERQDLLSLQKKMFEQLERQLVLREKEIAVKEAQEKAIVEQNKLAAKEIALREEKRLLTKLIDRKLDIIVELLKLIVTQNDSEIEHVMSKFDSLRPVQ